METETLLQFDPIKYKETTLEQWNAAANAWYRWSPLLHQWLGNATDKMLEMAEIIYTKSKLIQTKKASSPTT